jgi:hypothetical protein
VSGFVQKPLKPLHQGIVGHPSKVVAKLPPWRATAAPARSITR